MPSLSKATGLLAEFALFPVESERQAELIAGVHPQIESQLRGCKGFVSGTIFRSRDGLQVTSYIQWQDADSYVAIAPLTDFAAPDARLYEIFAQEPQGHLLQLSPTMDGLINFGTFKMKSPEGQPRFVELFCQALEMVSGQAGLISTYAHRSLDGWRCINFGHWRSLEAFTAMDTNRPFSPLFGEMLDLANNEYKKDLHEVVFCT